ncbi:hypothetical protein Ark11_0416 [Candidatus Ichthyocystis hellenicum]|uniref:Uncharacterized protein n=2 Tax=Candidatus Ichthyocystis hellenicum TaxID=1561003 RepID=A0A0S4M0X3_9BURK|nr:hypothetical protein Ark11_0416 [Candidatus Ichthyocystis hellenicum]
MSMIVKVISASKKIISASKKNVKNVKIVRGSYIPGFFRPSFLFDSELSDISFSMYLVCLSVVNCDGF